MENLWTIRLLAKQYSKGCNVVNITKTIITTTTIATTTTTTIMKEQQAQKGTSSMDFHEHSNRLP